VLKLFWTPAPQGGVPADPAWQNAADSLVADQETNPKLQSIVRAGPLPPIDPALAARLDSWLAHRSHIAPVTLMAHGFDYDPAVSAASGDPFDTIYGLPGPTIPAELSLLPLVGECDEQGQHRADVAIGFAWLSEGTMSALSSACWNNDYQLAALDLTPLAAKAFAMVLGHFAARAVPVHILAHSLGTRLVSQAIGLLRTAGHALLVERVILLGGAEFCVDAAAAFAACPFDVINLANRHDRVLPFGEMACHPVRPNGTASACVIGLEGLGANRRWIDLQLDAPGVVAWFAAGHAPTGTAYALQAEAQDGVHPLAPLNHWAYYTNPGNRVLVRDLVQSPAMTAAALHAASVPDGVASVIYGQFDHQPIPPTPPSCAERRPDPVIA
jgi:hypothetical protein